MVKEAAVFAAKAHHGMVRKGTNIPYITHPLEAALIVALITRDEELVAAALLHDVVEDAGVTREELEQQFGSRVARLVLEESEDKAKSWEDRKQATVDHLKTASRETKIVVLGDKLSNMRSTAREYMMIGDQVWERFNEKRKEKHEWYYGEMIHALEELKEYQAYQELVELYEFVFGA